jgi:hypothetical protein
MMTVYLAPRSGGDDSEGTEHRNQAMATFYTQLGLKHLPISHPIKALNKVGSEPLWYYGTTTTLRSACQPPRRRPRGEEALTP